MSEWKNYFIGDLFDITSGLSKPRDQFGFGTPFLSFKDVFNNYFIPGELAELVNASEQEKNRCSVKKGDIFITRTSEELSEVGMSSVALREYPNATFNGFTKRLRFKDKLNINIDPVFIGYLLRSARFRKQLVSTATMTTRASLNNSALNVLEINLPDLEFQKAIGKLLKSFDDKIKPSKKSPKPSSNTGLSILNFPMRKGSPTGRRGGRCWIVSWGRCRRGGK